jgi:hypothetical protein
MTTFALFPTPNPLCRLRLAAGDANSLLLPAFQAATIIPAGLAHSNKAAKTERQPFNSKHLQKIVLRGSILCPPTVYLSGNAAIDPYPPSKSQLSKLKIA